MQGKLIINQSPKNFMKPTLGSVHYLVLTRDLAYLFVSQTTYISILLQFRVSLFALNQSCIFIKSDSTQYLK